MRTRSFVLLLLLSTAAEATPPVWQQQHQQKFYDIYNLDVEDEIKKKLQGPQTMTGNWDGSRTYLEDHGLMIFSSYITDMLGNPHGGHARGFAYAGSYGLALELDFDKALGRETGFEIYSSLAWRTGTNLSSRKIDNEFAVAQVYGTETVVLNELFFKESLFDKALVIKVGRLNAGNDFITSTLYAEFVSYALDGNPAAIFSDFPALSVYPNAPWGAYLEIQPSDFFSMKFAAYNANSNIFKNQYHGVNFTLKSTNGVIWITEWAALVNQGKKATGLPGNYKIGFLYQTANSVKYKEETIHGNYCAYLLIDQMIYRKSDPRLQQGLTPFAALLFAPNDRNTFPFFLSAGLIYEGLFDSRPWDTTNFGIAYGNYSSDLADVQRAAQREGMPGLFGTLPQNFEIVLELNHWFQVNNWFTFTPDIQYIINPSGFGTIPNALVIGAQIGIIL
jgi:porin